VILSEKIILGKDQNYNQVDKRLTKHVLDQCLILFRESFWTKMKNDHHQNSTLQGSQP